MAAACPACHMAVGLCARCGHAIGTRRWGARWTEDQVHEHYHLRCLGADERREYTAAALARWAAGHRNGAATGAPR